MGIHAVFQMIIWVSLLLELQAGLCDLTRGRKAALLCPRVGSALAGGGFVLGDYFFG